jgi:hypothetical protein
MRGDAAAEYVTEDGVAVVDHAVVLPIQASRVITIG